MQYAALRPTQRMKLSAAAAAYARFVSLVATMPRCVLSFCLLALASAPASAQDSVPRAHDYRPVLGLRVGAPLRAAFNLGLARGRYNQGAFVGTGVVLEAGSGGGQVSLARTAGSAFGSERIQVSLLRTWGDPQGVAPRQTFVGVEARLMVGIGVGLGYFRRISGAMRGDGHVLAINLVGGI